MRQLFFLLVLFLTPVALSAQSSKSKLPEWPSTKPQKLLMVVKPLPTSDSQASNDIFGMFGDGMMSTRCAVVSVKDGLVKEKEILISHKTSERLVFAAGENVTVWVEKSISTAGGKSTTLYTLVGGGYFE